MTRVTAIRLWLLFVTLGVVSVHAKDYSDSCLEDCELPECYCRYEDIPDDTPPRNTPQMVMFTYSGALTKKVRDKLTEIFPISLRNPSGCPVSITLFVVSQGTDDCGLHKFYIRGHEIALSGVNRTTQTSSWNETEWTDAIISQKQEVVDFSNIDEADIVGMRAQGLWSGGDAQYRMMAKNGILYDSTISAGPTTLDPDTPYMWPFTLHNTLKEHGLPCKTAGSNCPKGSYPNIWVVPLSPMISTRMGKARPCAYLDECITEYKKSSEVMALLKRHFMFTYRLTNRAPLQINIQARTLASDIAVQGLKDFITYIMTMEDTWLVTMQETLEWVRNPTPQDVVLESDFWTCHDREYIKCKEMDGDDDEGKSVTLRSILDVDQIWIWQSVILVVLYIVIFRYDRDLQARKKK